MRLSDTLKYLLGNRAAILAIAQSRGALGVGALLVLSGSIARTYDGADLIHEWTVLARGLGVSIANAFVLYSLVYLAARARAQERPRFFSGYLSFLGLFWMTAPLAWLYAVPYERFMTPVDAVRANAWTLALVSVWRVALITRALAVLWGARYWAVLFIVLGFADVAVFLGTRLAPVPMIDFMGGLQHAPEEEALAGLNFAATFWSVVTAPLWLIGLLVAMAKFKGKWSVGPAGERVSRGAWAVTVLVVLAWAPLVIWAQPEQHLRHSVEAMLRAGDVAGGMARMSRHERREFPPVWDPPPRLAYGETEPSMDEVRAALAAGGQAQWVRELYLAKSWRSLLRSRYVVGGNSPADLAASDFNGMPLQEGERATIAFHLEHDERMTPQDREALRQMLERPTKDEGGR